MEVRFFDDIDAFAAVAVPHLEAREAENNLPIGIVTAIRSGQYSEHPPLLMTVEDDGQPMAVALRTPPHDLIVSFDVSAEAVAAIAAALRE